MIMLFRRYFMRCALCLLVWTSAHSVANPSDELRKGLAAALHATPFVHEARGGLGDFLVDTTAVEEAVAGLTAAVQSQPSESSDTPLWVAPGVLGALLVAFGQSPEEASWSGNLLKASLTAGPQNYLALLARGLSGNDVKALRDATRFHPAQPEAWLALGDFANSKTSNNSEAADAYRRAINLRPKSRFVLGHAGEGLRRLGHEEEAVHIFKLGVERALWSHPLQRPRHRFWSNLESSPLLGTELEDSCGWCRDARLHIESAMQGSGLRKEFEAARVHPQVDPENDGISYYVLRCAENKSCLLRGLPLPDHGIGSWAEYTIWDPSRHDPAACASSVFFPQLCALVSYLRTHGVPMTRLSITEVYPPKTFIPRHSSPQQGRLRLQCPLVVPAGSVSRLIFPGYDEMKYNSGRTGKCFWFDESFEHELQYKGDQPRASLLLDVPHPALLADMQRRKQKGSLVSYPGEEPSNMKHEETELELHLEAPGLPRHWELLWWPMAALARDLGLVSRATY